jgi:hypothetical protein
MLTSDRRSNLTTPSTPNAAIFPGFRDKSLVNLRRRIARLTGQLHTPVHSGWRFSWRSRLAWRGRPRRFECLSGGAERRMVCITPSDPSGVQAYEVRLMPETIAAV